VVKILKPFEQFIQTPDVNDPPPDKPSTRLRHLSPPKVVRFLDVANEKAGPVAIHQSFQGSNQMRFIPKPAALAFVIKIELEQIRQVKEDDGFSGNFRDGLLIRHLLSHQPRWKKEVQSQRDQKPNAGHPAKIRDFGGKFEHCVSKTFVKKNWRPYRDSKPVLVFSAFLPKKS
jgi:hypothetical protein